MKASEYFRMISDYLPWAEGVNWPGRIKAKEFESLILSHLETVERDDIGLTFVDDGECQYIISNNVQPLLASALRLKEMGDE